MLDKDQQQQMIVGCKYKTITEILCFCEQKKYQNPLLYLENKKNEEEIEKQVGELKRMANFVSHSQIQFYQGVMRNMNPSQEFIYLNLFSHQFEMENAQSVFLFLEKEKNTFTISYNEGPFEKVLQIRLVRGDETMSVSHSLLSTGKGSDIVYIRNKFIENILLFDTIASHAAQHDNHNHNHNRDSRRFRLLGDYSIVFELVPEDHACTDHALLQPFLYQVPLHPSHP